MTANVAALDRSSLDHRHEAVDGSAVTAGGSRSTPTASRVLITDTVTNVCCESSARDASILGYRVIMIADANAARRDQDHNATLYTIYRTFGDVRSTAEVLHMVEAHHLPRGGAADSAH